MDTLLKNLESELEKRYKLKFLFKNDRILIKNKFYFFRIVKKESYELFYLSKGGILNLIFRKQFKDMKDIHVFLVNYFKEKNIRLSELYKMYI